MRWVKKFTLPVGVLALGFLSGCALFAKDPASELAVDENALESAELSQAPTLDEPAAAPAEPESVAAAEPSLAETPAEPLQADPALSVAEAEPLPEAPVPEQPTPSAIPDPAPAPEPDAAPSDESPPPSVEEKRDPASRSGNIEKYAVKRGDTLMKIAYRTYGDLTQWKKILELNRGKLQPGAELPAGMEIELEVPSVAVQLDQNGNPYLIRLGDTLGSISSDVYRTPSKWRKIYENNRQLIKDPHRIYAGFTLYYLPEPSLASVQSSAQ